MIKKILQLLIDYIFNLKFNYKNMFFWNKWKKIKKEINEIIGEAITYNIKISVYKTALVLKDKKEINRIITNDNVNKIKENTYEKMNLAIKEWLSYNENKKYDEIELNRFKSEFKALLIRSKQVLTQLKKELDLYLKDF